MKVQLVNPFIEAAVHVVGHEAGEPVTRGPLRVEGNPYTTEDVTAVVGMSGDVRGSMYLSMSTPTALALVSKMLGQPVGHFDELAQSGIGELSNVVAGTASTAFAVMGLTTTISPPLMLIGAGASMSALDLQRLVVELTTPCGTIRVHVAVRDS